MIGKTINTDSLMRFRESRCGVDAGHYASDCAAKVVARGWQKHCCPISMGFVSKRFIKPGFSAVQEGRH
jgi:hypothetical protein